MYVCVYNYAYTYTVVNWLFIIRRRQGYYNSKNKRHDNYNDNNRKYITNHYESN